MTNLDAVNAMVAGFEVNQNTVELELINMGISPESEYTPDQKRDIAKASCKVLSSLLVISSFKEGDLTVNHSIEGIKDRIITIAKENKLTDILVGLVPTVSNASDLW